MPRELILGFQITQFCLIGVWVIMAGAPIVDALNRQTWFDLIEIKDAWGDCKRYRRVKLAIKVALLASYIHPFAWNLTRIGWNRYKQRALA